MLGMKLRPDGQPVIAVRFNCLDNSVRATSRHIEARRQFINRHMVDTVHTDLAVAVHAIHNRAGFDVQAVAMRWILWILMRQCRGNILWNVQV